MINTHIVLALDYGEWNKSHIIMSNRFFSPNSLIHMVIRKTQEKPSVIGARARIFNPQKDDLVTFVVTSLTHVLKF